jgi:hypothetical protein
MFRAISANVNLSRRRALESSCAVRISQFKHERHSHERENHWGLYTGAGLPSLDAAMVTG